MLRSWCLAVIAAGSFSAMPVMAQEMDCPMVPTVHSLQDCVEHATEMGAIDNAGVARSLLVKLHSAENALARDSRDAYWTTINILGAFIGEVHAQAGEHIDEHHAEHMVMHAQMIIATLQASATTGASSSG